jgi:hypothetical protein
MRILRAAVVWVLCAGCGASDGSSTPDAGPADAAVCLRTLEPSNLEMSDPEELDWIECPPGGLASLDPVGIWHFHRTYVDGSYSPINFAVMTFARDAATCLGARSSGWPTDDVHELGDEIFARLQFSDGTEVFEWHSDRLCSAGDGNLHGAFADCGDFDGMPECRLGVSDAVRLAPIPGEPPRAGLEKVGEWRGKDANLTLGVRAANGLALVVRREDGLRVLGVSDPAAPVELAWLPPPESYEWYLSVEILAQPDGSVYAAVLSDTRGLVIFDVTDPVAADEVGTFPIPPAGEIASGRGLAIETDAGGTRAYLIRAPHWYSTHNYVDVIDLSAPATPVLLGSYTVPGFAFLSDIAVSDRRVYLTGTFNTIEVLDASDPGAIVPLVTIEDPSVRNAQAITIAQLGGCRRAAVVDQSFGGSIRLIGVDEACPGYLQDLGSFALRPEVAANDLMIIGDRAWVAYDQDGVRLLDLSDPTAPSEIAHYVTWTGGPGDSFIEGALGVDVDPGTGTIYVADSHAGLVILEQQ